ncbi:MAG TPA: Gfo/Idh/MocA family oxidoreductase [Opitutales bacterium]|nr:Gfo/Idh/MocA family oxidoreductase [Opitutales bacterium]
MRNRREFLKGAAWMGAAAFAAGCTGFRETFGAGEGGFMTGYAAPAMKKVCVGFVGLGSRGTPAVLRVAKIPGMEVAAICDLVPRQTDKLAAMLKADGKPAPKVFTGDENAWKRMCGWDGIDVVYNATPWALHAPIGVYAMKAGKHVFIEVPSAMSIDECWELVEASEATRRHCMQLENCCYGEIEMLALNLCRTGMLGDLVHGEGAYIHDLRGEQYAPQTIGDKPGVEDYGYWNYWRLEWNRIHGGNQYPTHGLGPICQYMGVNRGDRFDYLVSLESKQVNFETYAKKEFGEGSWQAEKRIAMGDMNSTLIRTVKGRSILVQHDVSSPRPYNRINLISGTKGILRDYPYRVGWEDKSGVGVHEFFPEEKAEKIREEFKHPLWRKTGELAKKVGGHGGMDFIMDLRWAYCLQNGLPLDMNVYDLASWCSLCELSVRSVKARSSSVDVPDFTRGGWRNYAPLGIVDIDLERIGLS